MSVHEHLTDPAKFPSGKSNWANCLFHKSWRRKIDTTEISPGDVINDDAWPNEADQRAVNAENKTCATIGKDHIGKELCDVPCNVGSIDGD